jgi:hypothetical protein
MKRPMNTEVRNNNEMAQETKQAQAAGVPTSKLLAATLKKAIDKINMVVPAGKLESVLGVTRVKVGRGRAHLAMVDSSLAEGA